MANTFLKTIKTITQSLIEKAHYDKTRTGQITGANTVTNTYTVLVDGHTYNNVRTVNDFSYAVGDIVKVVIPSNQATQMYISGAALSDESIGKKMGTAESLLDEHSGLIADLQTQIDGKIETWVQNTNPADDWSSSELEAHDGDLWYYNGITTLTVDNVEILPTKTYQYDASNALWVLYNSPSRSLFDFVDGKTTIFYGTTSDTYDNVEDGDYLVDGDAGTTYKWDATNSTWVLVSDYTSAIDEAIEDLREDLEEQIDAKIETWVQMTDPANNWTTTELQEAHDGDLWFYNGITNITIGSVTIEPSKTYQYDSDTASWVLFNSSSTSLFDFADGKSTVWYGVYNEGTSTTGISPSSGDFFYNTSTGVTYIYLNSAWTVFTAGEDGDYLVDPSTGSTYKYDLSNTMWILVTDYASAINTITSQIATIVDELGNVYQLYITTVYSSSYVTHVATLTQNGIDITNDTEEIEGETIPSYSNDMVWCTKTIDGYDYLGTGSSIVIPKSQLYYGQVVSVWWTRRRYAYLLNSDGDILVNSDGDSLIARAEDSLFEEEEE